MPYTIITTSHDIDEALDIIRWCDIHIGKGITLWNYGGKSNGQRLWHFLNQDDAIKFALAWT